MITSNNKLRKVLIIGGTDPSSGAGIQIDLSTLIDFRIFPFTVITTITAQNSQQVRDIYPLSPQLVSKQFLAILEDTYPDAVKIGVLGNEKNIQIVAQLLEKYSLPNVVLDPILEATTGEVFLDPEALPVMKEKLLPLATVITPNIPEAEKLSALSISNVKEMKKAARSLSLLGPRWVLIKGGHLPGSRSPDILYNGEKYFSCEGQKIKQEEVRGTGCIFSTALAAHLALGRSVVEAASLAKEYVETKIKKSVKIGKGRPQTGLWRKS